MIELFPNFQKNATAIVEYVKQGFMQNRFKAREGALSHAGSSGYKSKFSSLLNKDMPQELIDMIFNGGNWDESLQDFYQFIQIQRYMPGEYIVPHIDKYDIKKLHLVCMTSSEKDAFYVWDKDSLIRIEDKAGQKIVFDYDAMHFVPTVTYERYSLVIGE